MRGARPSNLIVLSKTINALFVRLGCLKFGSISSKRAHSASSITSFGDATQIEIAFRLEILAHFLVIKIVALLFSTSLDRRCVAGGAERLAEAVL